MQAGHRAAAVGAEARRANSEAALQYQDLLSALGIPDPGRPVPRAGDHAPAVGAEAHGPDLTLMPSKDRQLLSGLGIPDARRPVLGTRHHPPAVGAKAGGAD